MTKAEIYTELRKIGYAKQKALKLARTAEPHYYDNEFYDFSDRGHNYTANRKLGYIIRIEKAKADTVGGYYSDFWKKVVA